MGCGSLDSIFVAWAGPYRPKLPVGKNSPRVDYALARQIAEGAFLVVLIDEDADPASREKFCGSGSACRIATAEALSAFAKAAAAKPPAFPMLALVMAERKRWKRDGGPFVV